MAYVSSLNEIEERQLNLHQDDPSFRKATLNMMAATEVCKKSLLSLPPAEQNSLSLIVATYFGEVTSSLEFLTTLYETKMAKPILFQNSLHNSTLGFVSIQLGITGPAVTLSADANTDHAVGNTARALLHLTDHVLICYVDLVPDFLKQNYIQAFPELSKNLGWARAFLISNKELLSNSRKCNLQDFNFFNTTDLLRSET